MARRRLGFWKRGSPSCWSSPLMIGHGPAGPGGAWSTSRPTGPVIIVANHISHADPFTLAHFVYDAGRWPRLPGQGEPVQAAGARRWLRAVEQTPVERGTVDAVKALDAAVAAVEAGKCVLIYPEGTTTKEPDLWPMRGKTGAARLWLATGAPVIPIAMWGPQRHLRPADPASCGRCRAPRSPSSPGRRST